MLHYRTLLRVDKSRRLNKLIDKEKPIVVCRDGLFEPSLGKMCSNILFLQILQNVHTLLGPP